MQKKKRFLALLLALVVALPFIQSPLIAQAAGEGSVTRKITVVKGKDINDIQYDGKNVLHSSAWWYDEDGTKHPAYEKTWFLYLKIAKKRARYNWKF